MTVLAYHVIPGLKYQIGKDRVMRAGGPGCAPCVPAARGGPALAAPRTPNALRSALPALLLQATSTTARCCRPCCRAPRASWLSRRPPTGGQPCGQRSLRPATHACRLRRHSLRLPPHPPANCPLAPPRPWACSLKPSLLTTSGQEIPIFQARTLKGRGGRGGGGWTGAHEGTAGACHLPRTHS